jgi:hypothetical protein
VVTWVDFVRALYEYLDDTALPSAYEIDEARFLKGRNWSGTIGPHGSPENLTYKCLKALLGTRSRLCPSPAVPARPCVGSRGTN